MPVTKEIAVAHDDGVLKLWRGQELAQMLVHPRGWCVRSLQMVISSRDVHKGKQQCGLVNHLVLLPQGSSAITIGKHLNSKPNCSKNWKTARVSTLPSFESRKSHRGSQDGEIRQFNKNGKALRTVGTRRRVLGWNLERQLATQSKKWMVFTMTAYCLWKLTFLVRAFQM